MADTRFPRWARCVLSRLLRLPGPWRRHHGRPSGSLERVLIGEPDGTWREWDPSRDGDLATFVHKHLPWDDPNHDVMGDIQAAIRELEKGV